MIKSECHRGQPVWCQNTNPPSWQNVRFPSWAGRKRTTAPDHWSQALQRRQQEGRTGCTYILGDFFRRRVKAVKVETLRLGASYFLESWYMKVWPFQSGRVFTIHAKHHIFFLMCFFFWYKITTLKKANAKQVMMSVWSDWETVSPLYLHEEL